MLNKKSILMTFVLLLGIILISAPNVMADEDLGGKILEEVAGTEWLSKDGDTSGAQKFAEGIAPEGSKKTTYEETTAGEPIEVKKFTQSSSGWKTDNEWTEDGWSSDGQESSDTGSKDKPMPEKPMKTMPDKPEKTMPDKPEKTMPEKPMKTMPEKPLKEMPGKPEKVMPDKPVKDGMVPDVWKEQPSSPGADTWTGDMTKGDLGKDSMGAPDTWGHSGIAEGEWSGQTGGGKDVAKQFVTTPSINTIDLGSHTGGTSSFGNSFSNVGGSHAAQPKFDMPKIDNSMFQN